jgi:cadmium resistance protein CadD (predicted permease)
VYWVVPAIVTAFAMFAATNIDDAVVLVVLNVASQAGGVPKRWQIWAGQYLGFSVILLVAFTAALGLRVVPVEWVGLMGLIPLLLGIRGLLKLIRTRRDRDPDPPVMPTGLLSVVAVTVANGGDNIALYTPVFRIIGVADAAVTLAVFAVCTALWCLAGQLAVSHQRVVEVLQRSSRWLVPVVFVVLGSYIVGRSGLMGGVFR